jgi:hypothetical protein
VSPVSSTETSGRPPALLRDRSHGQRVTNIELFFDLVYVFAVTQLSHYLLSHSTVTGALQAGLLLAMVWLVWAYTTWVTNWLDPDQMAVRLLLVALMLVSLAMSTSLPRAFADLGLWVGGAYAIQQVGRTVFMVIALRGHPLQVNFQRILAWCVASSALAVAGGVAHGHARALLWIGAVCIDRQPDRLLHSGAGPVPHLGLDHRGRPLRRAVPGVHADRAGRVDRHHRRDPVRQAGRLRQRDRVRGRVRRRGRAVVGVLRPERRGRRGDDRGLG